MRGYGFQKVLSGETTIEEVLSVTAAGERQTPSPAAPVIATAPTRLAA